MTTVHAYTYDPVVSADIIGDPRASVVDAAPAPDLSQVSQ